MTLRTHCYKTVEVPWRLESRYVGMDAHEYCNGDALLLPPPQHRSSITATLPCHHYRLMCSIHAPSIISLLLPRCDIITATFSPPAHRHCTIQPFPHFQQLLQLFHSTCSLYNFLSENQVTHQYCTSALTPLIETNVVPNRILAKPFPM